MKITIERTRNGVIVFEDLGHKEVWRPADLAQKCWSFDDLAAADKHIAWLLRDREKEQTAEDPP